ncbi:hypothetical protein [Streptomyces alboflavus]|uniref:hypothetical protein n=1 Tax=Streptomyces alboflavus TaxID=67267 RepID=UPI00367789B7
MVATTYADMDMDGTGEDDTNGTKDVPATVALPGAGTHQLPDMAMPVDEQVPLVEAAIRDITAQYNAARDALDKRYHDLVGPYLVRAHEIKSYTFLRDANDRPYKSFERYAKVVHGIELSTAKRIIKRIPVLDALRTYAKEQPDDLTVKQIEVLYPVLKNHGTDAVVKVWDEACAAGDTSPVKLAAFRAELGYGSGQTTIEGAVGPATKQLDKVRRTWDPDDFDAAADANPETAEWVHKNLGAALERRRKRLKKADAE